MSFNTQQACTNSTHSNIGAYYGRDLTQTIYPDTGDGPVVYGWSWCGNTVTFQIIGSDTGFIDVFIPLPAGIASILSLNVIMTGAGVVGTSSIQRTFIIQSPSGDGITTGDETVLVPDTTPDTGGVYAYFPGGFGFRIEFFCSTPGTAILYGSITITTPIAS